MGSNYEGIFRIIIQLLVSTALQQLSSPNWDGTHLSVELREGVVHQTLPSLEGADPGDDGELVLHGLVPLEQEVQTAAHTGSRTDRSHREVFLLDRHTQAGQLRHPPDLGGGEGRARGVDPGLAAGPGAVLHLPAHVNALHQQLRWLRGVTVAPGLHVASFGEQFEGEAEESCERGEAEAEPQEGGKLVTLRLRLDSGADLWPSLLPPPGSPALTAPALRLIWACLESQEVRPGQAGDL